MDETELANLKKLCRIECTPEEEKEIIKSLQSLLEYVGLLKELDTEGVPACSHVLQMNQKGVVRKDEVKDLLSREVFLANAPDQIGGMVRVPPILKESP